MTFNATELEALIPRLRRYAHALARHPVQPDDLVQDALERAWSRRRQWQHGTDLRAWTFAILHNVFISHMRRPASRLHDDLPADLDPQASAVDPEPGVALDLERALAALSDDQRAVVLLVGLEDLGYRETADVLGVPIGTVMSRLSRARARLRLLMDGGPVSHRDPVRPDAPAESSPTLSVVRRTESLR